MRENKGKMWTRITPNTDTFYAVKLFEKSSKLTDQTSNNPDKSDARMPFGRVFAR